MPRVSPREQGDFGELSAMEWLALHGYSIYLPVFHSPDVDLIAVDGERVLRVQVKTSTHVRERRWVVAICTRGGNQSWNGLVKRFSASRCDLLFIHVGDGRRFAIPVGAVDGTTCIRVGGPKYAPYEVERGRPIPLSRLADRYPPSPRRGSRAVKWDAL
ncbi:MAG TPA: group I intron-associated PD-(D/E)XK endonuclease [Solirubrobacteraceae bacterium]|nr:group I intron-associated PD-(D/E)XK endonuclease [Solirubrobacteraceae bacterium]